MSDKEFLLSEEEAVELLAKTAMAGLTLIILEALAEEERKEQRIKEQQEWEDNLIKRFQDALFPGMAEDAEEVYREQNSNYLKDLGIR